MKKNLILIFIFLFFLGGPLYVLLSGQLVLNEHWRTANRSSADLAPNPFKDRESIVQIYGARTYGWRGMFAIHTWIAIKPKNQFVYTVYQALGWNYFRNQPVVDVRQDIPDRVWFSHQPKILFQAKGEQAEKIIAEIQAAVKSYPYKNGYHMWPGPNSNTFVAYVIRHSPSIKISMPMTAIGKDYLINGICESAISKTGVQCSLKGVLGFTFARVEGVELNILGFSFGINRSYPFVHLSGIDQ